MNSMNLNETKWLCELIHQQKGDRTTLEVTLDIHPDFARDLRFVANVFNVSECASIWMWKDITKWDFQIYNFPLSENLRFSVTQVGVLNFLLENNPEEFSWMQSREVNNYTVLVDYPIFVWRTLIRFQDKYRKTYYKKVIGQDYNLLSEREFQNMQHNGRHIMNFLIKNVLMHAQYPKNDYYSMLEVLLKP